MNLYQVGYFREGRQGSNAGWEMVAPSKGMSQIAKEGFKGIAAKLAELKKIVVSIPAINTGVFLYDRFVYLMNVNYAAKGKDRRGVTYVHGYCFSIADYYELCANPEKICGVTKNAFPLERDDTIDAFPMVNEWEYTSFSFTELLNKYQLSDEEYRLLVLGAINAIENYRDPLCISLSLPDESYSETYRELLYLIMKGLPYHLRIKISAFSYAGSGATVYLSDHVEGNNYIDLDKKEFGVDISRMSRLGFTKIYNTLPANAEAQRDAIFQTMADFTNKSFANPLKDAGCALVEAGFQKKIKKNENESGEQKAEELLNMFLGYQLTDSEEVLEYLVDLLSQINGSNGWVRDSRSRKRLLDFYEKAQCEAFDKEMDRLLAREILSAETKGYDKLNEWSRSEPRYSEICMVIQKIRPDYYEDYYLNSYLKYCLTRLNRIQQFLMQNPDAGIEVQKRVLQILEQVVDKEMSRCADFRQLKQTKELVDEILSGFSPELRVQADAVGDLTSFLLWENFKIAEFDLEEIADYKTMQVEQLALQGWSGNECATAGKVMSLIELFEENDQDNIRNILVQVLFENSILTTIEEKKNVQEIFRSECIHKFVYYKLSGIDCLLAVSYDFTNNHFNIVEWAKYVKRDAPEFFRAEEVRIMREKSVFLSDDYWSQLVLEDIQGVLRNLKKTKDRFLGKDVVKGLERYSDCLCGKKIRSERSQLEFGNFCDSLHRITIGAMMIYVLEYLLRIQGYSYEEFGEYIWIGGALVLVLLSVVITVLKAVREYGFGNMMESYGINTIPKFLLYLVIALVVLAGIVAAMILDTGLIYLVVGIVYIFLALIGAIICFRCTDD